jgi:hypothetical protein
MTKITAPDIEAFSIELLEKTMSGEVRVEVD